MAFWEVDDRFEIDLEGIAAAEIGVVAGEVTIRTGDVARLSVQWEAGPPVEVSLDGGTVSVVHRQPPGLSFGPGPRATVDVVLPATAPVDARTVSADLFADGLSAGLAASTVSGAVTVAGGCRDLSARTVSGEVAADLQMPAGGRATINTVSGEVVVRVPPEAGLEVEMASVSGHLGSAFDLESTRRPARRTISGRIGDGAARLDVATVSGDITLVAGVGAARP